MHRIDRMLTDLNKLYIETYMHRYKQRNVATLHILKKMTARNVKDDSVKEKAKETGQN